MSAPKFALLLVVFLAAALVQATDVAGPTPGPKTIALPAPRTDGSVSIEKALKERRALRNPAPTPR